VRTLPTPRPIRIWERVDRARFLEELRPLGEPAVLRGLSDDWPAVAEARRSDEAILAYLSRFATTEPVEMVVGPPEIEGRFSYSDDLEGLNFVRGRSPVNSFFDRLLRDRKETRPYGMAMQSASIPQLLPGLEVENSIDLPPVAVPPRIWIGNAIRVATHADASENIAVNVAGRRRFTLFPPEAMADLYIGPIEFTPAGPLTSLVHVTNPDLHRFPRFERAMALAEEAELAPGDAIYIPFHWWHHVDSLDNVNILVNYWWNISPRLHVASPLDASILAMLAMRDLPADQKRAFAAMIRHYVLAEGGDPGSHIPEHARGILGPVTPERVRAVRSRLRAGLQD
jgi:hypothetical protein